MIYGKYLRTLTIEVYLQTKDVFIQSIMYKCIMFRNFSLIELLTALAGYNLHIGCGHARVSLDSERATERVSLPKWKLFYKCVQIR